MLSTDQFVDALRRLCTGLLYPSETDAPIDVYVWNTSERGAMTFDNIAFDLHHPEDVHVSESEAEEFFEGVTDIYEWHTPEEVEETKQYQALKEMFFANVTKPIQLWFGENKVDVLVLGRTSDGNYVGLRTFIVET